MSDHDLIRVTEAILEVPGKSVPVDQDQLGPADAIAAVPSHSDQVLDTLPPADSIAAVP